MKKLTLLLASLTVVLAASAQEAFPGLQSVLTAAEWKRAGLDKLSPDEIGVIDAALIRREKARAAQAQAELQAARATAPVAAVPTAGDPGPAREKRFFERFGLPVFDDTDWRTIAPLKARVVAWETQNRFRLDNGQVWEGLEPITVELLNRDIEIHARPNSQFVLVIDGKNTTLRVFRLR
jgi:hypothetical protein